MTGAPGFLRRGSTRPCRVPACAARVASRDMPIRWRVALKAMTSPDSERSVAFRERAGFTEMIRAEDYGGSGRTRS
jgi:hypothetical protein